MSDTAVLDQPQSTLLGSGQTGNQADLQTKSFVESLPEEYRQDAIANRFNNMGDFFKSYKEMNSLYTKTKNEYLKVPGEGASEEEVKQYRETLGIPHSVDGYQFDVPEGVTVDDEFLGSFKAAALELGVPAKQAAGIVGFYLAKQQAFEQQQAEQQQAELQKLQQEYGNEFENRIKLVHREVASMPEPLREALKQHDNDPAFFRLMNYFISGRLNDSPPAGRISLADTMTAEKALERQTEIQKKMMTLDRATQEYKNLDQEWNKLELLILGNK
jgi:hypothetical protein